jgi:ABC-type branched-subunit amino acid transport system substrate-binding protein
VPVGHVEGLYSCLDYYQGIDDPFSQELLKDYNRRFPGSAMFTAGSGCSGHYKALKLWEAAVKEAGTINQQAVIKALDHAFIDQAPGGPAEMVPGQHHLRLNMYIAQARNGKFEVVKDLGVISPKETSRSTRLELSTVN